MLKKIISGGQIGADEASLVVGKKMGYETGGFMPAGFKTKDGGKPEYEQLYGMKQTANSDYPTRTRYNVNASNGTIRLANDFETAGERCTMRFINQVNKPYYDIHLPTFLAQSAETRIGVMKDAAQWLRDERIVVLNVAGNGEHAIKPVCETILTTIFLLYRKLLAENPIEVEEEEKSISLEKAIETYA